MSSHHTTYRSPQTTLEYVWDGLYSYGRDPKEIRGNSFLARCPAHDDKTPSLSVSIGDKGLLMHCFAGCDNEDILNSIGMEWGDLFYEHQQNREEPRDYRAPGTPRPTIIHEKLSDTERNNLKTATTFTQKVETERGITLDTLIKTGCGLKGTNRIIIPTLDRQGKLSPREWVPLKADRTEQTPKMRGPANAKPDLWPRPETENYEDNTHVLIVEGEPDALIALTHQIQVVSIPGTQSWQTSDAIRFQRYKNVTILLDDDEPGRRASTIIANDLRNAQIDVTERRHTSGEPTTQDLTDLAQTTTNLETSILECPIVISQPQKQTKPNKSSIELVSYNDLGSSQPVEWLPGVTGYGRIPLGELTMFYGEPGVGKGSITMSIIAEATKEGVNVLLSTPEDDPLRVVKPRLTAAQANLELVHYITSKRGEDETTIDIASEAEKIIEAALSIKAQLIVIDPVSEHFGANVKDERENREKLAPFLRACREHQIAILAIGHTNRMTGGSGYMRAGGSSALYKVARSAFVVGRIPTPDEDQNAVTKNVALIHDKSNLGPLKPGIVYQIKTKELVLEKAEKGKTAIPIITSLAVRIGETTLTSEDILDERKTADREKIGACAAWLKTYLTARDGIANKKETEDDAKKLDQSWTPATLRSAAQSIGAKCGAQDKGSLWSFTLSTYDKTSKDTNPSV